MTKGTGKQIFMDQAEKLGSGVKNDSFPSKKESEGKDYQSFLLPEGLPEYFEVKEMKKEPRHYIIYLEENGGEEHCSGAVQAR